MRAYIGGTFDILHPGHIKLFRWAKRNYEEVVVALNTDEFVTRYKGKPPVMNYEQRFDILREVRSIDEVMPNYEDEDSRLSITLAKPNTIIAGSDWTVERLMKQMNLTPLFLQKLGIHIHIYGDSDPIHSSDIKKRMA
jgi:glycerol-3-phosphate cytidylyltransferase